MMPDVQKAIDALDMAMQIPPTGKNGTPMDVLRVQRSIAFALKTLLLQKKGGQQEAAV